MKILLAGSTGVIGRRLLPLLVEAGHEVAGTTRKADRSEAIAAAGARPVIMDALDRDSVLAALKATQADVVIHQLTDLSGWNFAANSRLRIEGTRHLVDAAKSVGVGRMISQSIAWVCVPGEGPSREEDALDLDTTGLRHETVAAVQALEEATAEIPAWVVLRYGFLYGPGTAFDRDGGTSEQMRRGEIAATPGVMSFLHVADAAKAAVDALEWPSGVYNIVDDMPAAGTEWVPLYARLVNAPAPAVKAEYEAWERGASNAKARGIGWRPLHPDWREGFRAVMSIRSDE